MFSEISLEYRLKTALDCFYSLINKAIGERVQAV